MVVWGGVTVDGQILGDGAAFDPTLSGWRRIAGPSGVAPRHGARSLGTGAELLVVGGQTGPDATSRSGVAPAGRVLAAAWTGREAIAC